MSYKDIARIYLAIAASFPRGSFGRYWNMREAVKYFELEARFDHE